MSPSASLAVALNDAEIFSIIVPKEPAEVVQVGAISLLFTKLKDLSVVFELAVALIVKLYVTFEV